MIDLIMPIVLGAGLAIVAGLVFLALQEEREQARERAEADARPGRHSLEAREARTRRIVIRDRRFNLDDTGSLIRPYVSEGDGEDGES